MGSISAGCARYLLRQVSDWPWSLLMTGLGCGLLLPELLHQYCSQLGTSAPVSNAACIVIGLAWALAWIRMPAPTALDSHTPAWRFFVIPAALCACTVAVPFVWIGHDFLVYSSVIFSRWMLAGYAAIWAAIVLGVPVWCIARLTLRAHVLQGESSDRDRPSAACLLGLAAGLGLALVATWGSLYLTAIIGCIVLVAARVRACQTRNLFQQNPESVELPAPGATTFDWAAMLTAATCGGLSLWSLQVLELVLPVTIYTLTAVITAVLIGIACGCRFRTEQSPSIDVKLFSRCCAVAGMLLLSAGFPIVVYRLVSITGTVSQVWSLHALRSVLITGCLAPIGLVWSFSASRMDSNAAQQSGSSNISAWGLSVLLALAGAVLTAGVLIPAVGLNLACYVLLWCVAGVQLLELARLRLLPRYSLVRVVACGCLIALVAGPLSSRGVRPELAARLLFATNVFQADQLGIPRGELSFQDDARLVAQTNGDRGIYTVWKSTMTRHQIRENGIPCGTISTDSQINPQDSSEVLLSLLPLTLHEQPNRVAILGLGASVPLQTVLACPTVDITAIETDPQRVALLKQITSNTEAAQTWQDERLTLQIADPALWVAAQQQPFDVLISNPEPSSLLHDTASYTREFYQRASRRLTVDGIFCQRFAYHDFGPLPLQTMAATLRSVFRHVLAVETGPGEVAWLATNSEAGFIRSTLVERMQAEHVRGLMATVGWDWSVLLTLAAYDDAGLLKAAVPGTAVNSASNGRFCVRLPSELMRWAPKSVETQKAVTAHAGKLLDWVGKIGSDEDLLRRLGEVRGLQEVITNFPDQYWGYRGEVRKHIASRPLSPIQQIKYEKAARSNETAGLHPDDKRRLRYFQQLSKALHSQQTAEVLKLADYEAPYDPLVSLFMHEELAEAATHVPQLSPRVELIHRLHKLYYAPSSDSSVRNALAALRLVFDKPDAVVSQAERWEVMNGLLQILQYRWNSRVPAQNSNARLAVRDVEENIVLAERVLQELPQLGAEVGYSSEDCQNRQRVIRRNLIGPLRVYREQLRPLAARQSYDASQTTVEGNLPTEEELKYPGADQEEK